MLETRRHDNGDRWADSLGAAIQQCIALAAPNVQDLQERGMPVQADFKAMQAASGKSVSQ